MFYAKSTSFSAPFCMIFCKMCAFSALKALLVTMNGVAVNSNKQALVNQPLWLNSHVRFINFVSCICVKTDGFCARTRIFRTGARFRYGGIRSGA